MSTAEPVVTLLLVLVIGIVAGILFDRLAGPSWLTRQFVGSARGVVTSALVGVAGAFVGTTLHSCLRFPVAGISLIAAAVGATVVLFAWRLAK